MIGIIDYGAGNLFSVKNALDYLGVENIVTSDEETIRSVDKLILPGVGAFADAMKKLTELHLIGLLKEEAGKKPFLGICLGMQLLFSDSDEFGLTRGLDLIPGTIRRIQTDQKIPHMGYNQLIFRQESPLLKGISEGANVYFVHSYMAYTEPEYVVADCDYSTRIPGLVQSGETLFGAQFHPEKSGDIGLQILKNFAKL